MRTRKPDSRTEPDFAPSPRSCYEIPGPASPPPSKSRVGSLANTPSWLARDFCSAFSVSHPEWHWKMLFIEGLDEVRPGWPTSRCSLRRYLASTGEDRVGVARPIGLGSDRAHLALVRLQVVDVAARPSYWILVVSRAPLNSDGDVSHAAISGGIWSFIEDAPWVFSSMQAVETTYKDGRAFDNQWPPSRVSLSWELPAARICLLETSRIACR